MKNPCFSNEHTVFSNDLALKLGIAEAIILGRIHYWIDKCGQAIDDKKWVYNTVEEWQKQLPFLSIAQLTKIFYKLRQQGILIARKINKSKRDHTLWYTINYNALQKMHLKITDCSPSFILEKNTTKKISSHRKNRFVQMAKSYNEQDNTKQDIITPHTPLEISEVEEGCVGIDLVEKQEDVLDNVIHLKNSDVNSETQENSTQQKNNHSDDANAKIKKSKLKTVKGQGIEQSRDTTAQKMVEIWNQYSEIKFQTQPGFWLKRRLTKTFAEKFHSDIELWKNFCSVVSENPFLSGKTSKIGWKADLEWILRPAHLDKIFTGAYGIDQEKLTAQDKKIAEPALETQINQSEESEKVKQLRLGLLKHFGVPTYVSWFQDTPIEIDQQGRIQFQTESTFRRAYIERLMQNISWAKAA